MDRWRLHDHRVTTAAPAPSNIGTVTVVIAVIPTISAMPVSGARTPAANSVDIPTTAIAITKSVPSYGRPAARRPRTTFRSPRTDSGGSGIWQW